MKSILCIFFIIFLPTSYQRTSVKTRFAPPVVHKLSRQTIYRISHIACTRKSCKTIDLHRDDRLNLFQLKGQNKRNEPSSTFKPDQDVTLNDVSRRVLHPAVWHLAQTAEQTWLKKAEQGHILHVFVYVPLTANVIVFPATSPPQPSEALGGRGKRIYYVGHKIYFPLHKKSKSVPLNLVCS